MGGRPSWWGSRRTSPTDAPWSRRSNAELERYAYLASHDLKDPLRHISEEAGQLAYSAGPRLTAAEHEHLHQIVDGASRMQRMLDALLELSAVDRYRPKFEPTSLEDVLHRAAAAVAVPAEALAPVTPLPTLEGDPVLLEHLCQNLLQNSMKFRTPGTPLRVEVGARQEGDWLLWFRDNGIGLPEGELGQLFQPFARAEAARRYPGSGIGLSLCQSIARHHRGAITARRPADGGAEFEVHLPARQSDATGAPSR
jgi:signal transduction histidine kinase